MLCKRTSWSPSHALQNGIVEPLTSLRGTCRSPSLRAIVVHHLYEPLIGSPSLCCAVFVRRSTLSGTQGRRRVAVPAAEEFAVPPSLRATSRSPSLRAIVHRHLYEPLVGSPSLCCLASKGTFGSQYRCLRNSQFQHLYEALVDRHLYEPLSITISTSHLSNHHLCTALSSFAMVNAAWNPWAPPGRSTGS